MDPYELAKSSQTTVRSFLPFFASRMSCVMALVCSKQPENPGTPPFWTEVSIYKLPVRKDVSRFARMAKNIFPSTLSNEIVLNLLIVLESRSFGVNIPSASFQEAGTSPFRQKVSNKIESIDAGTC